MIDSDIIRVLVVDDSAYSRQTIKRILESINGVQVIGIATDGIDAIAKTLKLKPDLITLDLEMPEMDGFAFLRYIMKERPTPVIVVSSYSDAKTVFKALDTGAVDFIPKPTPRASVELQNIREDLVKKVLAVREMSLDRLKKNINLLRESDRSISKDSLENGVKMEIEAIGIGSSTGGPQALSLIIPRLPEDFRPSIFVSQHMPRGFTASLADRLNRTSKIKVKEAEDGEIIRMSTAYICPGGCHMVFNRKNEDVYIKLIAQDKNDRYIPSVDKMLYSLAHVFGKRSTGVVITGMGNDGMKGILEIKSKGGYTIAESEETAVVFGMPNEAIKTGAVDRILPVYAIAGELTRIARKKET